MDNQLKYIKDSPISQKQYLKLLNFKFICFLIIWILLIVYLADEWNNQLPKIIISRLHQTGLLPQNNGIQLKFLSQTLLIFDNALIVVHSTNGSDLQQIYSNQEGYYNIPFGQLEIQICNESKHNITCANQNQIAEILNNSIEIEILLQTTLYDSEHQKFYQIPQSFKYQIHKNNQQRGYLTYQIVSAEIRYNNLFSNRYNYNQISDATLSFSSINQISDSLSKIKIEVNPNITKHTIVYDKMYIFIIQIITMSLTIYFLNLIFAKLIYIKKKHQKLLNILSIYFPQQRIIKQTSIFQVKYVLSQLQKVKKETLDNGDNFIKNIHNQQKKN